MNIVVFWKGEGESVQWRQIGFVRTWERTRSLILSQVTITSMFIRISSSHLQTLCRLSAVISMVLCIWIYITRLPQSTDITEYDQVVDSLRNLTRMRQMNDLVAKLTVSVPLIRFNATGLALNKYTKRVIMVLTSGPKQEERMR